MALGLPHGSRGRRPQRPPRLPGRSACWFLWEGHAKPGLHQHPPAPGEMSRGRTGKTQEVRLVAAAGVRGERLFRESSSGHGQATGHKCLQEAPCVSRTEGARLGSRAWGGGGSPMFPQGPAEGRGPEDSRRPLEAEGLGGTVL